MPDCYVLGDRITRDSRILAHSYEHQDEDRQKMKNPAALYEP